jgi:hypothetical protein
MPEIFRSSNKLVLCIQIWIRIQVLSGLHQLHAALDPANTDRFPFLTHVFFNFFQSNLNTMSNINISACLFPLSFPQLRTFSVPYQNGMYFIKPWFVKYMKSNMHRHNPTKLLSTPMATHFS